MHLVRRWLVHSPSNYYMSEKDLLAKYLPGRITFLTHSNHVVERRNQSGQPAFEMVAVTVYVLGPQA